MKSSGLTTRICDLIVDGFAKTMARVKALEARITELETAAGTARQAPTTVRRSVGEHAVGEVIRYEGREFRCVAPNRYRAVEDGRGSERGAA